jgi:hypothetical protein
MFKLLVVIGRFLVRRYFGSFAARVGIPAPVAEFVVAVA